MTAPPLSAPVVIAILFSGGLLVLATALACRPRRAAASFGWMVVAGLAYAMLALAAALHLRDSGGLRASLVQLLAVALAALLGLLCGPRKAAESVAEGGLGAAARGVAWLTLVGLPPTLGFHAKVVIYRVLLTTGWAGLAALAIVASAAGMAPALWAFRAPRPAMSGPRAIIAVALIAAIIVLGVYPQPALTLADLVQVIGQKG